MPRYYFHLRDDLSVDDEEGQELPNLQAAREVALQNARSIACEAVHKGHLNLDHRIDVADATGEIVLTLPFREAFTIEGR